MKYTIDYLNEILKKVLLRHAYDLIDYYFQLPTGSVD